MAAFTRHAHALGEPAPDELWAHERVVERLMADRAVLPMRFGSTLDDEASLRMLLANRQQHFLELLARVTGRVELSVRALRPVADTDGDAVTEPASGRAYIMRKLHSAKRLERAAEELHAPLEAMAVDACRRPPRGDEEVLRGAYLVERRMVERFQSTVERLQCAHPEEPILCTGPWPPYSFVN